MTQHPKNNIPHVVLAVVFSERPRGGHSGPGWMDGRTDDVMMTIGEAVRVEITRTTYLFERLNDLLLSA